MASVCWHCWVTLVGEDPPERRQHANTWVFDNVLRLGWSLVGRRVHRSATEQGIGETHRVFDALLVLAALSWEVLMDSQRALNRALSGLAEQRLLPLPPLASRSMVIT